MKKYKVIAMLCFMMNVQILVGSVHDTLFVQHRVKKVQFLGNTATENTTLSIDQFNRREKCNEGKNKIELHHNNAKAHARATAVLLVTGGLTLWYGSKNSNELVRKVGFASLGAAGYALCSGAVHACAAHSLKKNMQELENEE